MLTPAIIEIVKQKIISNEHDLCLVEESLVIGLAEYKALCLWMDVYPNEFVNFYSFSGSYEDYLELIFRYFLPTGKDATNACWHKRNKLIIYEVGYNQFPRKGYLGYLKLLKAFTVHITLQFPLVIYSCICYKQISVYLEYDQHASYL